MGGPQDSIAVILPSTNFAVALSRRFMLVIPASSSPEIVKIEFPTILNEPYCMRSSSSRTCSDRSLSSSFCMNFADGSKHRHKVLEGGGEDRWPKWC